MISSLWRVTEKSGWVGKWPQCTNFQRTAEPVALVTYIQSKKSVLYINLEPGECFLWQ